MVFKFVAFAALVAAANAGVLTTSYGAAPLAYSAPVAHLAAPLAYATPLAKVATAVELHPEVQYSYGYSFDDTLTGDSKSQHEQRTGDNVQGKCTVVDADGFRRIVDYTADPIHGFNAVVCREPLAVKVHMLNLLGHH